MTDEWPPGPVPPSTTEPIRVSGPVSAPGWGAERPAGMRTPVPADAHGPVGAAAPPRPAGPPVADGGAPVRGPGERGIPGRASGPALRRGPRKARLTLRRLDPWSSLKVSFVYALALYIVLLVAVAVLYGVLSAMGVFDSVSSFVRDVTNKSGGPAGWFSFPKVFGATLLLGGINVVLVTALSTLGAFLYNICADLVGGLEVTLSESD